MATEAKAPRSPANLFRRGGTWYARFFAAGQLQRVSLRTTDLREAKIRLKGIRQKADRQAFGAIDAPTWEDAVIAYSTGVLAAGGVKASTAKRYTVSLRQIHEAFAGRKLPTITVAEIGTYIETRQKGGATNATVRRDLTTISQVLEFARSRGMVTDNAATAINRKQIREARAPIAEPTEEMIAAGIEATQAAGIPQLGELMRFLRANGVRTGEALHAQWSDIHDGHLTIRETKNSRVRTIELAPDSLPAIKAKGRLFPTLPLDTGTLAGRWAWVKRRMPRAQHFRLHDLRHAYAIAEMRSGRDIYDLSHHLGHGSVKVTEIYLGYAPGGRAKGRR